MKFIQELRETRLFRSDSMIALKTAEDLKNITFLYFLTLCILKEEFTTAPWAQEYLARTFARGFNFETPIRSASDLYWCFYLINGKKFDMLNQKFLIQNEVEMKKLSLNQTYIRPWVLRSIKGTASEFDDRKLLYSLGDTLNINFGDYNNLKRLVPLWNSLGNPQRAIICTRLLYALRKYARLSDIYPVFDKFVNDRQYFIAKAVDPENPLNRKEENKNLIGSAGAVALGMGVGLAVSINSMKSHKQDMKDMRQRIKAHFESLKETTSASIASTAMPMSADIIKRPSIFFAKRGNRKKKGLNT